MYRAFIDRDDNSVTKRCMSYFFTRIPTQWSPAADYSLSDDVILRPAGRLALERQMSTSWHDSIFFITRSSERDGHIQLLREWIPFHAFFFAGAPDIVSEFEMGRLADCVQVDMINGIPDDPGTNKYVSDYDNIAQAVYFFHETDLNVSYRDAFHRYHELPPESRDLIALWLFPFNRGIENQLHRLFDPSYINIATKVTVLEAIIGHGPNCATTPACPVCEKQLPHRAASEKAWRKQFLDNLPMTSAARTQYAALIDEAYHAVRHPMVHAGAFPTAQYIWPQQEVEVYDHERSINEFRENSHALLGLTIGIASISRYLLLDKLFNFRFFPELPTLRAWTNRPGGPEVASDG